MYLMDNYINYRIFPLLLDINYNMRQNDNDTVVRADRNNGHNNIKQIGTRLVPAWCHFGTKLIPSLMGLAQHGPTAEGLIYVF